MTFDRPFDRSSIGTNAYSIAPVIAPSIGFERLFDRLSTIPPHPYGDRSARRGLGGRWRFARLRARRTRVEAVDE